MRKLKDLFYYALMLAATVYAAWDGVVRGNSISLNLFKFYTWLDVILTFVVVVGTSLGKKGLPKRPKWKEKLSGLKDIDFAFLMAAYGHFVYAVFWILIPVMDAVIHTEEASSATTITVAKEKA